ncbi:MAG: hypothetical protein PHW46_05465 [Candidatus Omnitrophica bacterium]|nr:hypothetical protein [Candidatus Omnitrophota bacterium]
MEKKVSNSSPESTDNMYAILAYLWILCLVPLLMKKDNEFIKFHSKQGLMLFIIEIGVSVVGIIPLLGAIVYILGFLVCGILSLIGIVQVLMGNKWKIPMLGDWAEQIKI